MENLILCLYLLCPFINAEAFENGEYVYLCYHGSVYPPITGPYDDMDAPIETDHAILQKACDTCGLCFGSSSTDSEPPQQMQSE